METTDRATRARNVRLDPEADDYLRIVVPRRTGIGAFFSRLILEHKLRHEITHQRPPTRQAWPDDITVE